MPCALFFAETLQNRKEVNPVFPSTMTQTDPAAPETLLIVDDDELNRAILENIFAGQYHIEQAENGRQGLDAILADPGRLCAVLLDVMMPEMNGLEVLRELNARGLTEQVPVFLITAETGDEMMKEAYGLGVMDVIGKPVVPYLVQRRVGSVVELFRARRRLGSVVERQKDALLAQAGKIIELSHGMIASLAAAIEFRSGESGDHVRRLQRITRELLTHTEMGKGMSQQTVEDIALAAVMHDVGKIAIPDAILNKPGRLTAEEFEVMKTHTIQGAKLLENIPQMRDHSAYEYAIDIALHHHERWDGRGYPHGLVGDEISVGAQIVSLADVYDALVSPRVYKAAFSHEKALEMILNGECGVFSPRLLECFRQVHPQIRALYETKEEG